MTVPKATVDDATRDALLGLAIGDVDVLKEAVDLREAEQQSSGLDPVTFSLVKIAALIALDSPPASYLWQIANALDAGATPADVLGVLRAVAPQVGGPKIIAAAPEIMVALGLSLPAEQESMILTSPRDRPWRLNATGGRVQYELGGQVAGVACAAA
ncbi:MAG TPA: carboxymuconolactone decarboxylase family protein [Trebonia sp.]|nr:carboxymuconolactone decarboxylase family protein [Trebonia sp.]